MIHIRCNYLEVYMKKVAVVALCACFSVQAEASVSAYLRAAAIGSLTDSDFDMNYSVNRDKFPGANPSANNNKHSIGNVGGEFALGIRTKFKNDWFVGGELNYALKKVKHNRDFTEIEDNEGITNADTDKMSNINLKYQHEYGFSFRFGKYFNDYDVYGICGATTKSVDIDYSLNGSNPHFNPAKADLTTNSSKRIYGMVFGLGASRKVNDNFSCSVEYKYKVYNSGTKSVDWRKETEDFFANGQHDKSDRNFKVKSDSHELSFGFTLSV